MGYRTVVVFNNDRLSAWAYDPALGSKIAADLVASGGYTDLNQIGGRVVQCAHADDMSLIAATDYTGRVVATDHMSRFETVEQQDVRLLKDMARRLGYRVSKMRV